VVYPYRGPKYAVDKTSDSNNSNQGNSEEPPTKKPRQDNTDSGA